MGRLMDEDEKLFMKFVEDGHRLSTGTELEGWQKSILLKWYRFHKLYPNAKIVMGRKSPLVVIPKEEENDI